MKGDLYKKSPAVGCYGRAQSRERFTRTNANCVQILADLLSALGDPCGFRPDHCEALAGLGKTPQKARLCGGRVVTHVCRQETPAVFSELLSLVDRSSIRSICDAPHQRRHQLSSSAWEGAADMISDPANNPPNTQASLV